MPKWERILENLAIGIICHKNGSTWSQCIFQHFVLNWYLTVCGQTKSADVLQFLIFKMLLVKEESFPMLGFWLVWRKAGHGTPDNFSH